MKMGPGSKLSLFQHTTACNPPSSTLGASALEQKEKLGSLKIPARGKEKQRVLCKLVLKVPCVVGVETWDEFFLGELSREGGK